MPKIQLDAGTFSSFDTDFPIYTVKAAGGDTSAQSVLQFSQAGTDEHCYSKFILSDYTSGDITITVSCYADTANSGSFRMGSAIGAITPNTDDVNVPDKALASSVIVTTAHPGGNGERPLSVVITLTGASLDSATADDFIIIDLFRNSSDVADDMAGFLNVTGITIEYN